MSARDCATCFDAARTPADAPLHRWLCATSNGPTLILVSHHVEEIPAQGTHGLLLKDGRVLAAGRLNEVLTDQLLSELYDYPCKVGSSNDRYWLR